MSIRPESSMAAAAEVPLPHHLAELARRQEAVQEECQRLRRESAELTQRLGEAQRALLADRESHRAALNLMEDVIAARRAEQRENAERRRAEQELREANRRKDEFLAMLSHELRNPLAPLRTAVDRLRLKVPDDSDLQPIVQVMDRQLRQLKLLVDDLLDVGRITRGNIPFRRERTDLEAVIANALEMSRPLIDARKHELTYTPSPEPLILEADPTRLAQVLTNLLANAAKFMEPGGRIWLTVARDQEEAVVRVQDAGKGIAPEMLAKIFDLFVQANHPLDRSQGGLGIGLTVAKRLVDMHGGSLTAHSAGLGQGSEFVVRLPLLHEAGGTEPAIAQGVTESSNGQSVPRRILLVDDLVEAAADLGQSITRSVWSRDSHGPRRSHGAAGGPGLSAGNRPAGHWAPWDGRLRSRPSFAATARHEGDAVGGSHRLGTRGGSPQISGGGLQSPSRQTGGLQRTAADFDRSKKLGQPLVVSGEW